MQKIILLFSTICFFLSSCAQTKNIIPELTTITHKLGDTDINLKLFRYGTHSDIVFLNLHDNESTSVAGTKKTLETSGGLLIKIENDNKRNINFRLDDSSYTFDPNRIFSRYGIEQTLIRFGTINNRAITEVEKFATRILDLLPPQPSCVITLHNNTDGGLSVSQFVPGAVNEKDAKKVYENPTQDADDFFLTTDSLLFHQLAAKKYNTIWQDNVNVKQDGSLSVYFGEKNIRYLNCETEHGKIDQYEEMITAAVRCIELLIDKKTTP